MEQSETIGKLAQAIAHAQAELKPVKREAKNPFFNSRYADLASIWEALKPFHAHGIAISQIPFDAGEGMIGLKTQLSHESGEWIAGKLALPVSKEDAQGVGSAITYARRYALGCMTGVVTEDDDDGNQAAQAKPAQRFAQQKATVAQKMVEIRHDIKQIMEQDGADRKDMGQSTNNSSAPSQQASDAAPFNPETCPPADGIADEDFQAFLEYVGDDPDRTKVGKKMKAKLNIQEMASVPPAKRKAIMLSIQDEAKRQAVPFSEWVKD